MASVENLDTLSNAEIRLKCIEFGLPNVPVTDSSRKLLLKRLRDAIASKDGTTKETTAKSSSRRETIHISKTAESVNNEPLSLSQPVKSRRTIAATAPISKDDSAIVVPTSIPISTRRRSVQKEVENKPAKATTMVTPTILIEDDEEDNDLVNALENAEKESTTSSVQIETISSRRKSRSVSVPKVTEVVKTTKKRAMTPLVEEKIEKEKNLPVNSKDVPDVAVSNNNAASQKSYQPTISSFATTFTQPTPKNPVDMTGKWYGVYDQEKKSSSTQVAPVESYTSRYNTQSTTSTVYSSPAMRYSVGVGNTATSYRSKYTASDILNEQSDTDFNNDDGVKSPFLSSFARTLERSKSVGRSSGGYGSGGHYKRRSGSNYESIRGRYAENEPTFGQLISSLNRRYKLKSFLIVIAFVGLSISAYAWTYSS